MTPARAQLRSALLVAATTLGAVLAVTVLALVADAVGVEVAPVPTFVATVLLGVLASPPVRRPLERRRAAGRGTVGLALGTVLAGVVVTGLGLNLLAPVTAVGNAVHAVQLLPTRRQTVTSLAVTLLVGTGAWAAQAAGLVDGLLPPGAAALLMLGLLLTAGPLVLTSAGNARDVRRAAETLERERQAHILALERAVRRDPLTGLLCRNGLAETLSEAMATARPENPTGLVYLDLDGFKAVNDRHGHAAGDALLREVADRLRQVVRHHGQVARIGGDEFVAVLPGLAHARRCEEFASRVGAAVESPVRLPDGTTVQVGASVGTAVTLRPVPPDVLLDRADTQMYARKRLRRSSTGHREVTGQA
ncbi:diguanylate cyclase domain-containing protein [Kineococcus gynurae]|uniref:Diguanylate cyclase domain-containing protein n=1 Tax=Kineococcus gynurae TaxID=452979 RepID=A0ABV5LRP4_9ACTN